MRQEQRMSRLDQALLREYTLRNARVADRGQKFGPGPMELLGHGPPLGDEPEPPRRP